MKRGESVLSYGQWARCVQAGHRAFGAGEDSNSCPYSVADSASLSEQQMGGAWLRGWTRARIDAERASTPVLP